LFIEPSSKALDQAKTNVEDPGQKIRFYKNICSNELNLKKSIYTPSDDSGQFYCIWKRAV